MKPIKPVYVLILVVIFAAGGFYGGMQYEKSHSASSNYAMGGGGQFGGGRGGRGYGGGGNFGGGGNGNGANRPVSGQIVSQGNNSITVKLADGSSKIVDYSGSTKINKSTSGSASDLTSGQQVVVFGTTNSDGSVTAQNISLGDGMMLRGRGQGQGGGSQSGSNQ